MCYSAQLLESYNLYVRMTGAEMDLRQFAELYEHRPLGLPIKIPPAIDRWFDEPDNGPERQIKAHIDQYRAATAAKLETEIFAQKKRLADADRKLAMKPTKAAAESKRIAENKIASGLGRLELLKGAKPDPRAARIFPMYYAPIVLQEGDQRLIRLARYHCRQAGKPDSIDRKFPGLYNARRDNLEKFWRDQFGTTHAVMLVQSFYENVERDGRNAILHFVPKPADTMLVACLYSEWVDPKDGRKLLSFAAITDEPPAEVAAAGHDRMIVNLRPENLDAWLSPAGRPLEELQRILSDRQQPFYDHEVLAA